MSALRWWAERVGRPGVVATNAAHGIGERRYVTNEDRSAVLDLEKLALVKDEHVRMSVELQAVFGLRREEAIKFTPAYADRGDRVRIKASWAKGGRGRSRSGTSTSAQCSTPRGALRAPARSSRAGAATPRSESPTSGRRRRRGFRACTGCAYAQARY